MAHCATIKDHEEENDDLLQELAAFKDTCKEQGRLLFLRDTRIAELSARTMLLEARLNGDKAFEGALWAGTLSCTRSLHMSLDHNGDIYCKYCGRSIDDALDEMLEVNNGS